MWKICIISNKTCKILSIAEETLLNYRLYHYLTPHCGVNKLIKNIADKTKNFTEQDYCVICIGEEHFKKTNNYPVITFRESLLPFKHTNILLCLPIFKFNSHSLMFNCRIEAFNNLLYLDVQLYTLTVTPTY